ncbi:hypothetical protein AURDEDRAFT_174779 [Auricularia subglabra TFB-10046 SS5]|uniref:Uncharacterized protein n=1 Tax=Auricularia subglabra (strain TFB-10046 / SS5) TaxID=717982 RepID=J0WU18_AURST|nr:hypothetical protein AURDEDRAFT_174779 [Auricularia subglabra TFB-10046 SS5]
MQHKNWAFVIPLARSLVLLPAIFLERLVLLATSALGAVGTPLLTPKTYTNPVKPGMGADAIYVTRSDNLAA